MLISVIIPTRERSETLYHTIKTALNQNTTSCEIVISDNYSNDNTEEVVRSFDDKRIKYVNTGKRLSMSDNWEFALSHAKGEYIIYIGDDDACMPQGLDYLEQKIEEHKAQAYMWITPTYLWPIDDYPAKQLFEPQAAKSDVNLNLAKMAEFTFRHGGWKYYELPGVYHAAVARSVLDAIQKKTGRVFHTTQPDLFTSMSIPAYTRKAVKLALPVTIQGRSAKSNGGSSTAKDGPNHLKRYIDEFGDYKIDDSLVPEVTLYGALLIDGIIKAKELADECFHGIPFNYSAMWAFLCRLKLINRAVILKNVGLISKRHKFSMLQFIYYMSLHDIARFRRFLLDALKSSVIDREAPDNIYDFTIKSKINFNSK